MANKDKRRQQAILLLQQYFDAVVCGPNNLLEYVGDDEEFSLQTAEDACRLIARLK